jgi:hypothetical protein
MAAHPCPRCEINLIPDGDLDAAPGVTVSRVTRDGGPPVYICAACQVREMALQASMDVEEGARLPGVYQIDPRALPGLTEWPLSIDQLLDEDRAVLEIQRRAVAHDFRDEGA